MGKNSKFESHALLGKMAYDVLPDWQKQLIRPDISPVGLAKPYIPDFVRTAGDKTALMCCILDFVYYDDCRPYATLGDGRWIPHSPPDANCQSSAGSGLPASKKTSIDIIQMLMEKMIDAVEKDDWESAIRHGGALAHFIQEPFTPGHAVDNNIFHELFPDPDKNRHIRLHHAFDKASDISDPASPALMGISVPEAAFRIQMSIDCGVREAKKLIPQVIASVYEGKPDSFRTELLAGQSAQAASLTASTWYTAISIAKQRFNEEEVERLKSVSLLSLPPYFWHACQYVELLPGCLVKDKRKIPIHAWVLDDQGRKREMCIRDGFGMGGYMGVKFFINGNVYPKFRCRVGLPSRHTEGQDEHTDTIFFVETDEKENLTYSEEIEYKGRRVAEVRLKPGEPLREIKVDIRGARSLILGAKSGFHKNPETGQIEFSIPHVAVCEPVLSKK